MLSCAQMSVISHGFSTISLCSWICAQLPQIYTNYKTKSAEGISPSFLLLWYMGDFLSLTSCLLNDVVLKFQIYLSLFFLFNDTTLCYQYYYYNSVYPRKHGVVEYSEVSNEPRDSNDETVDSQYDFSNGAAMLHNDSTASIHIRSSHGDNNKYDSSSPLTSSNNSYSPGGSYDSVKQPNVTKSVTMGAVLNGVASNAMPIANILADPDTSRSKSFENLGLFLAWCCTVVYMASRCPQLFKNYQRKSVEGISPLLFGAALLGNLTYTLSILTSCEFVFEDGKTDFFMRELPYILGSSGTIVFDIAYFYQRSLYKDTAKNNSVMVLETWDSNSPTA